MVLLSSRNASHLGHLGFNFVRLASTAQTDITVSAVTSANDEGPCDFRATLGHQDIYYHANGEELGQARTCHWTRIRICKEHRAKNIVQVS